MTTEEIIEGNKLIAEFMGFQKCNCIRNKNGRYYDYHLSDKFELIKEVEICIEGEHGFGLENQDLCFIEDLKFHSSWDWLMSVVEKIEQSSINIIGRYEDIIINGCSCLIHVIDDDIVTIETTKREAVFFGVVEFIKWYNEQSK